ncbi:hypothetical protein [Parapedobacter soli]|uniref:hypothetical protein n=1 Tax=Parapedobacter soli TaxID=416955 RepID=UPI0021C9BA90|nr:hypothetical protein [Parapedobacter soli]
MAKYDVDSANQLLIVSALVDKKLKDELRDKLKIVLWDRSNIANFLAANSHDGDYLLEEFAQLIMDGQQGIDITDPYVDVDESTRTNPDWYFENLSDTKLILEPPKLLETGEQLISQPLKSPIFLF